MIQAIKFSLTCQAADQASSSDLQESAKFIRKHNCVCWCMLCFYHKFIMMSHWFIARWGQPLRISFFRICRSCVRWSRSRLLRPHQSLILSSHSLHRRSFRGFPSILANIVRFISLLLFIPHLFSNSLSFRFLIVPMIVFDYLFYIVVPYHTLATFS